MSPQQPLQVSPTQTSSNPQINGEPPQIATSGIMVGTGSKKKIVVILAIVLLIILGGGAYYYFIFPRPYPINKNAVDLKSSEANTNGFIKQDTPCATIHYPSYYQIQTSSFAQSDSNSYRTGTSDINFQGNLNGSDIKLDFTCENDQNDEQIKLSTLQDIYKNESTRSPFDTIQSVKLDD